MVEPSRTLWLERRQFLREAIHEDRDVPRSGLIRSEILDSWRRCEMTGVTPAAADLPYDPDLPGDSRLMRAASPVISRLADQLSGSHATVLLADTEARIVDRRAGAHSLLVKLDNAQVAPGFGYAEEASGTNGIGTALEERRLFSVKGGEHYRESLQNLACVGKPIVHPIGGRMEGILDITSTVKQASDLMIPVVEAAVREIEQRLYEMASRDERALLEEFLRTSRKGSSPVITLSGDMVMTNPAAGRLLQPSDQSLLWNWACLRLGTREEFTGDVRLSDSTEVTARARRLEDGRRTVGIVLELKPTSQRRRAGSSARAGSRTASKVGNRPSATDAAKQFSGRGFASRLLDQELDLVAEDPGPTLITGERGVGKRYTARRLHSRWSAGGDLVEMDLALLDADDTAAWQLDLLTRAKAGDTLLLRHLDMVEGRTMAWLTGTIEQAESQGWRIVVTGPDSAEGSAVRAYSHFHRRLAVVPLNQRVEEIADIAREILTRPGANGLQRLQTGALQALSKHTWPDNVRELESVLRSAASRAMGGDIGLQHLPAGYREGSASRSVGALERAELETLLNALKECSGNKSLAAKRLGVARSTLYRKVREHGIDVERFVTP